MGVVILKGRRSSILEGELSVLSGNLHIQNRNTIADPVALITGTWTGDQNNFADLTGTLPTVSGTFDGYSSANTIEGELFVLDTSEIIASSNFIAIEDELPSLEGCFLGGGAVEGELTPLEGELTGTVPAMGVINHVGPVIAGSMFSGGEICFEHATLTGDMSGTVSIAGNISAESKLSILTGSFDATVPFGADLVGDLQTLAGTLEAHTDTSAQIQGYLTTLTGNLHAQAENQGSLEGTLQTLSGYLHAQHSANGDIEGDLSILIPTPGLADAEPYDYRILRFIRGETR